MTDRETVAEPVSGQELSSLSEIQQTAPEFLIANRAIAPYMLNWRSATSQKSFNLDGQLPTDNVALQNKIMQAEIMATAKPLSLQINVFSGSLSEISPIGEPSFMYDCLAQQCAQFENGKTLINLDATSWGEAAVVMVMAEYWRDPQIAAAEGATNLIAWVFAVTN